jgi:hypothetical protein
VTEELWAMALGFEGLMLVAALIAVVSGWYLLRRVGKHSGDLT